MSHMPISDFADKMTKIMPVLIKEISRRNVGELYKDKVTMPQFFILNFLNQEDESTMTDMAKFMDVTTAAMTGIVDRLVKYGYVLRLSDPDDRRVIKIKATAKGEDLVKKINKQRRQMIMEIFSTISQREREDYLRILTRIYSMLTGAKEGKAN